MKVRVTARARSDLDDIFRYLNDRNPDAANAVIGNIEAAISMIAQYPEASPLTSASGVRVKLAQRRRYLIYYRVRYGEIELLRVMHGARLRPFSND